VAEPAPRQRRVDPIALAGGLGTILVAAYILGGKNLLPDLDLRWFLAVLAGLMGIGLIAASLRR